MISYLDAAEVFRRHKKDILKAVRSAPAGWRVLAEVDGDGAWRGAGCVTSGTGSLLAHEGRGYALYMGVNVFASYADVEDAISAWVEEMADRLGRHQ